MALHLLSILSFAICSLASPQASCAQLNFTGQGTPFSSSERDLMMGFFLANLNIDGKGGVVAAPDFNTPGGSYYFHWERDGALSMRALETLYPNSGSYMDSYVQWVLRVQAKPDPHGIDVRTEPKYELPDGDVYAGSWCRPQTDGPGLRGLTMLIHAKNLNNAGKSAYVKQYLWTGDLNQFFGGTIKHDLDWVADNWSQDGCDLWEEIRSDDFFWNRFNFLRAMYEGSKFAHEQGDSTSAIKYQNAYNAIKSTIMGHYNGQFVFESTNRLKDTAVISAFVEGYYGQEFPPTSKEVAGTIATYNDLFCNSYYINQQDNANRVPGILYGRYEGDEYAGGNPWILTTASLAELLYLGAQHTLQQQALPEENAYKIWRSILSIGERTSPSYREFATLLVSAGDSVLNRIAYHVRGNGFHLSEQLDRNTGYEIGARDLTWSYANVLKAMHARDPVARRLRL